LVRIVIFPDSFMSLKLFSVRQAEDKIITKKKRMS